MNLPKDDFIYGVAISCMEKCNRVEIALEIRDSMEKEHVQANTVIYNSLINACARCNMQKKAYDLYLEMEERNISKTVITYNAILDAIVHYDLERAKEIFLEAYENGKYKNIVPATATSIMDSSFNLELDLHSCSHGAGEIAMLWWLEDYVPSLIEDDSSILGLIESMTIITGKGLHRLKDEIYYGKKSSSI